jgi:hypothetical protein
MMMSPLRSVLFSRLALIFLLFFLGSSLPAQKITPFYGPFPTPPVNAKSLFYMQRTIDRNTLMYEINYNANGSLNHKKPVKIYWIDYEKGATISQLTYAQNKFAYGIKSLEIEGKEPVFKLNMVSYKKIDLYLKPSDNGSYAIHVILNGKPCILNRVLVNITGGTNLSPDVSYIELKGKELNTGEEVIEKFKP